MLLQTKRLLVITGDITPINDSAGFCHEIHFRDGLTTDQIQKGVMANIEANKIILPENPIEKVKKLHELIVRLYSLRSQIGELITSLNGEITYFVLEEHRNKGYATETLKGYLGILSDEEVKKTFLKIEDSNLASKRVATKCEFHYTSSHIERDEDGRNVNIEIWKYKKR